ncbi:MAG: hypothetical protein H0V34_00440 [Gammaproteobacteria bacterium]|nr:hypothetical protein [Gammaproteobacteria bacterium]
MHLRVIPRHQLPVRTTRKVRSTLRQASHDATAVTQGHESAACYTQDEIAAAVSATQSRFPVVLREIETFRFCVNPGASSEITDEQKRLDEIEKRNRELAAHEIYFDPPIYNIWKQRTKSNGSTHSATAVATLLAVTSRDREITNGRTLLPFHRNSAPR